MVARICEELRLRGGERVLDVGTGSGYQAAVLAELAGEVHTIERLASLAERARAALDAAGYGRVQVHVGDGTLGDPEHAPGGRLVLPVGGRQGQELQLVVRSPEGPAVLRSVPCRFVPLVGEEGFDHE